MKFGIQSFSAGHFPIATVLDMVTELGCPYEAHWDVETIRKYRDSGGKWIAPVSWGVPDITFDHAHNLRAFTTADACYGVKLINVNPQPGTLLLLIGLVDQFGIRAAIHPHGPGHHYTGWKSVHKVIQNTASPIGICMDTGHVHRAGENPIEGIVTMRDRVFSVHLKDVDADGKDVMLGNGVVNLRGIIAALKEINFDGLVAIEWEGDFRDPMTGLRHGFDYLREIKAL